MSSTHYFRVPFATSGDKVAIPDPIQPSGAISYTQGFGPDYERDPLTDPAAKRVPRDETNQLYFDMTENIRAWQIGAYPEWVTSAQNGGTPVSYPISARVRYDSGSGFHVYGSLVDNNTALPTDTASWVLDDPNLITFATSAETIAGTLTNKAVTPAGLASLTATAARRGLIEISDNTETQAGARDDVAVTPASLASIVATAARRGLAALATSAEVIAGTVADKIVTPATLVTLVALDTRAGLVELATGPETAAGTDTARAVTPASLLARTATQTRTGLVELATAAETQAGTDATLAVTPAGLATVLASPTAVGLIEIATVAEVTAGTDNTKALTPANLAGRTVDGGVGLIGGGPLDADRNIRLGTPSSIGRNTINDVSGTTHTHALNYVPNEVFTSSGVNVLIFPIGHTVHVGGSPALTPRNQTRNIFLDPTDNAYYRITGTDNLAGEWRARGSTNDSTDFQRMN